MVRLSVPPFLHHVLQTSANFELADVNGYGGYIGVSNLEICQWIATRFRLIHY